MRNRETRQSRFGFRTETGGTLVPDLSTGTGRRTRKRGDRSGMVMRLNLHQDVNIFVRVVELAIVAGHQTASPPSFNDCGVIGIGGNHTIGTRLRRALNHAEQLLGEGLAINDPVGIEYLVPAMLGVRLRKHHEFDICRISIQSPIIIQQVIHFVVRQCETKIDIRLLEPGSTHG